MQSQRALERLSFPIQYLEIGEMMFRARNLDVEDYYRQCGLLGSSHLLPDQTINGHQMRKSLQLCLDACESSPAPLVQFLAHFPLSIHGPLGLLAITSATLGDAINNALEYVKLVMPAFEFRSEYHKNTLHIVAERKYDFGLVNDIFTELALVSFLQIRPFLTKKLSTIQVVFTHSPLVNQSQYTLDANVEFSFNGDANRLLFRLSDLSIPLLTPSRLSSQQLQATLDQQRRMKTDELWAVAQVRRILQEAIYKGSQMNAEQVASSLHVSSRTLSRHLQSQGKTLPQLQVEVSIEYAKFLLQDNNKSIAEIARFVGFQDSSSFSRAFKRTVGNAPTQFRNKWI